MLPTSSTDLGLPVKHTPCILLLAAAFESYLKNQIKLTDSFADRPSMNFQYIFGTKGILMI